MEKTRLNNVFRAFEGHVYKILTAVLSAAAGFFVSKASLFSVLSPFSLSLIATAPFSGMYVWSVYAGAVAGFITKPFSVYNFKYICAETIIFIIILAAGSKIYKKNVYSAILPAIVCLATGVLFLFAEKFSLYSLLLTVCEAIICGCFSFFLKYSIVSAKRRSKFDARDIISFNICLLAAICALDSLYVYGFSVSLVVLILLTLICIYFLKSGASALFTLPLCFVYALLHTGNDKTFLLLYLPALISIGVSKFNKKFTEASFILPYLFTAAVIAKTPIFNYQIYFAPVISAVVFKLIPKAKAARFLRQYVDVEVNKPDGNADSCDDLCDKYRQSAEALVKQISFTHIEPIISEKSEAKLKRALIALDCRSISFANYITADGKQTAALYFKSENAPDKSILLSLVSKAVNRKLKIAGFSADGSVVTCKFEIAFNYTVDCHALFKSKRGEKICGDCVAAFRSGNDVYDIILADGMGSGETAYSKSSSAVMLLKKLLSGGASVPKALASVNTSIAMQSEELGFSTLDICSVSLNTGVAEFYKCGAFFSFILRGNKIINVKPGGFPAGLSSGESHTYFSAALEDGDTVIMASDGVQNALDQLQAKMLTTENRDPATLTRTLLDCAYSATPPEYDDDMTVIAAKIKKQMSE